MPRTYQRKHLDDGAPNPKYTKQSNRHPRKYLDDGTVNPNWKPRTSGKSGKRRTKTRHGFFVAWDGEGINTGRMLEGPEGMRAEEHILTLLACGDGASALHLYRDNERLTSEELLAFIGESVKAFGPLAIHVSFFFTYDASHILRDVPRDEVRKAYNANPRRLDDYCRFGPYLIKYIPRKELYIAKLKNPRRPYKRLPGGKTVLDKEWSVTIWDAHGFFQGSFIKALSEWGAANPEQSATIERGKRERDSFNQWDSADVIAYNDTENVLLVELMNKLRAALKGLQLELVRWDGAGAIAAQMFKKELPQNYIREIPMSAALDEAGHYAFAGGRIEIVKNGTHNGILYRYDINSAYPSAMTKIPDLHRGEWKEWNGKAKYRDFALYRIEWKHNVSFDEQLPFYPFFHRDARGYIFFPSFGENWVWGCELNAAIDSEIPFNIRVLEGWEYYTANSERPFAFIERYYAQRAEIKKRIKAGTAGTDDAGISLAIKLGLNSMYGKTAQKVGYDEETGERPPYYNVLIAGWITAYTRATMFREAYKVKEHVIAFATDGIFTTEPIPGISDASGLGGWEVEQLHGIVMVQSGVYWTKDAKGEWHEKSRGFDRSDDPNARLERVLNGWKHGERAIPFTLRRFVASKYASLTSERWDVRCSWVEEERELELFNAGEKRYSHAFRGKAQHYQRLYTTLPNFSPATDYGDISMSEPARTPWDAPNDSQSAQDEDDETLIDEW